MQSQTQRQCQPINLANLTGPPGPVEDPQDCPGFGRDLPPGWRCPSSCPLAIDCYEALENNQETEE